MMLAAYSFMMCECICGIFYCVYPRVGVLSVSKWYYLPECP